MGRQWLHAKRLVAGLKKGRTTSKLVREISVAAKMGGADPAMNARLATAVEKAKKESVSRDVIERAITKGAGTGDEKLVMEHVVYEGYAPHKVPLIVEVYTDNLNRTASEIRVLFKKGQLGTTGSNKFLFETLDHTQNDDIPEGSTGAKFIADRTAVHTVSQWLSQNGWVVVTSELGYLPKQFPELTDDQRAEVGDFLQALDDHEDVHRVWAAVK